MKYEWPRKLSRKDMLDIIDLMNAVAVREHTLGFFEPLSEEQGMELLRSFDEELQRGSLEMLAVRDSDDRIVGMVTLARAPLPARRHIVDMRRCVIAPDHRGQFLLEGWSEALKKVGEMGCEVITLEVRDDGPTQLWARLGFKEHGQLPDYARQDGRPVTGHLMHARLADILQHFEATGTWLHSVEESKRVAQPA